MTENMMHRCERCGAILPLPAVCEDCARIEVAERQLHCELEQRRDAIRDVPIDAWAKGWGTGFPPMALAGRASGYLTVSPIVAVRVRRFVCSCARPLTVERLQFGPHIAMERIYFPSGLNAIDLPERHATPGIEAKLWVSRADDGEHATIVWAAFFGFECDRRSMSSLTRGWCRDASLV